MITETGSRGTASSATQSGVRSGHMGYGLFRRHGLQFWSERVGERFESAFFIVEVSQIVVSAMGYPAVWEPATFPRVRLDLPSLCLAVSEILAFDRRFRAVSLWRRIFNFRFGVSETGSTWRRDRFAELSTRIVSHQLDADVWIGIRAYSDSGDGKSADPYPIAHCRRFAQPTCDRGYA